MRLFVAVYPPPEVVADLVAQVGRLRIGETAASGVNVRLTAPEVLHLTLAFLGDVDESRVSDVRTALGRAAAGTADSPAPRIRLGGGGSFGRGRFTVLWAGIRGDTEALHRLSRAIRRELRRRRLPYDGKPWRPHLTIGRPGDRMNREDVLFDRSTLDGYLGPSWPVTELLLVRSHLGPRPTYQRVDGWQLGCADLPPPTAAP
ncbi:MAG TPA: RNA 2',3'-cyclic phosphodiesterase [Micromonospora sp.]